MKQYLKRGRRGFTLVEMLVSVALCMFIMLILTGSFQSGIDAFRILRSTGQMAEKLRIASAVIRRDVASQHFDGSFQPGLSGPYLSDQRLDKIGWAPPEMATSASTPRVSSAKVSIAIMSRLPAPSIIRWP